MTFRRKAGEWVEGAPTCECGQAVRVEDPAG